MVYRVHTPPLQDRYDSTMLRLCFLTLCFPQVFLVPTSQDQSTHIPAGTPIATGLKYKFLWRLYEAIPSKPTECLSVLSYLALCLLIRFYNFLHRSCVYFQRHLVAAEQCCRQLHFTPHACAHINSKASFPFE